MSNIILYLDWYSKDRPDIVGIWSKNRKKYLIESPEDNPFGMLFGRPFVLNINKQNELVGLEIICEWDEVFKILEKGADDIIVGTYDLPEWNFFNYTGGEILLAIAIKLGNLTDDKKEIYEPYLKYLKRGDLMFKKKNSSLYYL